MRARACILTPEGRGAIAVVRVWGPGALAVADSAFRPARGGGLAGSPPGRLRLGRMGAGLGDEVVAVVIGGGSPEVEVQCHGGPAPIALVLAALVAAGAESCPPEAWTTDAATSRLAAGAMLDLAQVPTIRTAEILLDQAGGTLDREVRGLLLAAREDPGRAMAAIDSLIRRSTVGLRLLDGWRVVLAGRPNVGKSRLLNALAGYERAIVDPTPGTTRDVVTARTAVDGWPVELADTAGLRVAADPIEATGVALARDRQSAADLVLLVLDRSEPLTAADRGLIAAFPAALRLANKADLPVAWDAAEIGAMAVSAGRGDGIEGLIAAIARRLVPESPPPGAGVPFRIAQVLRLTRARRLLAGGRGEAAARALGGMVGPAA